MTYLNRLWHALLGRRLRSDWRRDDDVAKTRELDEYIIRLVKFNLPNYKRGHPSHMKPEEWEAIKSELIELAWRIDHDGYVRVFNQKLEERKPAKQEDLDRFAKLLCENLYYLWD